MAKSVKQSGGNPSRIQATLERRRSNSAGAHQQGTRRQRNRRDQKLAAISESEESRD